MAIDIKGSGTKFDIQKIKNLLPTYNFIISTATQCIDTSLYHLNDKNDTLALASVYTGNEKALFLSTKKSKSAFEKEVDDVVVILEKAITDVKIKSKRNFLLNQ